MSDGLNATIGQGSARLPQNFTMAAGDRRVLKVTVFDEAGDPVPLAGTTAVTWKLGRTARSVPVVSKGLGDGVTLATDQAAAGQANCGRLDVLIDTADSADLIGEYLHECRMTAADGTPTRIFYGRVFVSPRFA
ncbi:MAG: hypothetical protein H6916_03935 [Novosphingobium sp.]|uniref:hypothetical protein n=1 Tax=Novosphingobium sp. TaxID=1874826 RepID=UPI0026229478|nr:hypothetical protein [Novosphingobium sp.]MCP5385952.1 hypothetical protein [Novosphingobium sp.]